MYKININKSCMNCKTLIFTLNKVILTEPKV